MERLILGFSAFFALFFGMFFEDRAAEFVGQSASVTQYGKATIETD